MEQPTIPPFDAVGAAVAALVTSAAVIIACGYLINWAADFFTDQKQKIEEWEK